MGKSFRWHCVETVGIALLPKPIVKVDVPPEVAERWAKEAETLGIPIQEYLNALFAESTDTGAVDGPE